MRKENVVYVNPNPTRQTRHDFEKLVTHVAAELHGVARVDKENVVRFEAGEEIDVDLLDTFCNQLDFEIRACKPLFRVRLDAREGSFLIGRERLGGDARRVTATYLDDSSRL